MITHEHKVSIEIKVSASPNTRITYIPTPEATLNPTPYGVRKEVDPWTNAVSLYLAGKKEVSNLEIATECLKLDPAHHDRSRQIRIANVLKSLKWKKKGVWRNNTFASCWVPSSHEDVAGSHLNL